MRKKKKLNKKRISKKRSRPVIVIPETVKRFFGSGFLFLLALIILFSFFSKAGAVGNAIGGILTNLIGGSIFVLPLFLILAGIILIKRESFENLFSTAIASMALLASLSAILALEEGIDSFNFFYCDGAGGWLGNIIAWPFLQGFGFYVSFLIFAVIMTVSFLVIADPVKKKLSREIKFPKINISKPKPKIKKVIEESIKKVDLPKTEKKEEKLQINSFSQQDEKFELKEQKDADYKLPPVTLLTKEKSKPEGGDINFNSTVIKRTLNNFGIPVEMSEVNIGPTVTQYTLKPAEGVKLSKITTLSNDLALSLAAHPIRIEAPIPGRSLVGIEIPNKKRARIRLRELVETSQFYSPDLSLCLALGRDVRGVSINADLSSMPHLLVAGATGSGKTICLNTLILSLLYRCTPDDMRLILVDPKRVEFSVYGSLEHLLCPIISNSSKAIVALKWLVGEMERRFGVLSQANSRDIKGYNAKASKNGTKKLPYIVLIIDELADLMSSRGKELEAYIVRLAQMSRAVGIHLILATQRPSVEVLTGLIKANITTRIAFQVASQIDSRTIIDTAGAERLLGKGDMLFLSTESPKPRRIQGPFISEKEVKKIADWLTANQSIEENVSEEIMQAKDSLANELDSAEQNLENQQDEFYSKEDVLYDKAKDIVLQTKNASTSFLQRRLGIGYSRAARLIDILEERGIVGPREGSKPRQVYQQNEE